VTREEEKHRLIGDLGVAQPIGDVLGVAGGQ
jgi:hypothetical protein